MPLDTGALQDLDVLEDATAAPIWPAQPTRLNPSVDVGTALRELRESHGLGLLDIADRTRVRAAYIEAIESLDVAALPPRPFSIGYVRAYADALGLETEAVARRFTEESPEIEEAPSPPPTLIRHGRKRPSARWAVIVAAVALALVSWNLSRHGKAGVSRPALTAASSLVASRAAPVAGPVRVGAPLPAPPEAATPPTYQTPGLAAAVAGRGPEETTPGAPAENAVKSGGAAVTGPAGARFAPAGAVYAIQGPVSDIILQARAPTSLVVRGAGGAVYFARQLSAGEAWRASAADGLIADVDNPGAVEVFVQGVSSGFLTANKTPLSRLAR